MTTASEPLTSCPLTSLQMMRGRFRAFVKILRRVARGHCAPGELHELRIVCRQLEAVLRLNRAADNSRAARWLRRRVRDLRRSANSLRDDDVLRKWLAENGSNLGAVRRNLVRERRKQTPKFVRRVRRFVGKRRLIRNLKKVLRRSKPPHQSVGTNSIFGTALFREVARFVGCLPTATADKRQLHRLRIAGKRLRYEVEAVAEVAPTVDLTELTEFLCSVQKQLGAILDQLIREKRIGRVAPRDSVQLGEISSQRGPIDAFSRWLQAQPLDRIVADVAAEIVMWIRGGLLEAK